MPQGPAICEAKRRVVDLYLSAAHQSLDRPVYRLLISLLDQFVGQLPSPVIQSRTPLVGRARLNLLLELENMKAVPRLHYPAYVSRLQRRNRFFQNLGELPLVVARQPSLSSIGRV